MAAKTNKVSVLLSASVEDSLSHLCRIFLFFLFFYFFFFFFEKVHSAV